MAGMLMILLGLAGMVASIWAKIRFASSERPEPGKRGSGLAAVKSPGYASAVLERHQSARRKRCHLRSCDGPNTITALAPDASCAGPTKRASLELVRNKK
jgi:hypothetical protein